jgi:hypothetical protein
MCQAQWLQQYSCQLCKKENAMTDSPITTIRVSDTELQVERTLYLFASRRRLDRDLLPAPSTGFGETDHAR